MLPTLVITVGCVVSESAAIVIAEGSVVGEGAVHSGEGGIQALGDAEEDCAIAFAASANEASGEVRPAARQEAAEADRTMASPSAVAVASGSGQQKAPEIVVAPVAEGVLSSTAAAGDESSRDDRRPLTKVLKKGLPELPSKEALAAALEHLEGVVSRELPPCPSASQLEMLARGQQVFSEQTLEISSGGYRPEARSDGDEEVDLEVLMHGVTKSLEVLQRLALRAQRHQPLWEAQEAFYHELLEQHKVRETELQDEVENLKTALRTSELNLAVARAEKEALAKVLADAKAQGVAEYKAGQDFRADLEQYGARCYKIGLEAGEDFGRSQATTERAREAFEAAVRECRRRTNDARLDGVRFAQF
ncbi:hypothetical protein Taro_049688 [Colocasia esculenta]|uniref:Uncharacterized protein n=1 Tax=Colocasia esculenta TaxID=4460 RepID=A0A843XBT2_COLES|nr:hypothetical protein [Colocasia esculenta]